MRNGFSAGVCAPARPPPAAVASASAPAPSMKFRRLGVENNESVSPQQKHPPSRGGCDFVISFSPRFLFVSAQFLAVENSHRPRPARRGALDLHGKTRHHKAGRGQLLEIMQFFDMAIADVAAGLVAFPDQA